MTVLEHWNALPAPEAKSLLLACCGSTAWASALVGNRPYADEETLLAASASTWFALGVTDWLQAFACHPRIGELPPASTAYLVSSTHEQDTAQQTLAEVAASLHAGNQLYEERFGFRYLVFASGRTAPELLAILEKRLTRTRDEEIHEAAAQQQRITDLRMQKWLHTSL